MAPYQEREETLGQKKKSMDDKKEEEKGEDKIEEQTKQMEQEKDSQPETITKAEPSLEDSPKLQKKTEKLLFWVYGGNYPETVSEGLLRRGNWQWSKEEDNIEKCHFLWRPFNYGPEGYRRIDRRVVRNSNVFIYNHFEQLKGITTKSGLIRSMKQYYFSNELASNTFGLTNLGQAGYSVFDSTATTFLLSSGVEDSECIDMIHRYREISRGYAPKERIPIKHCVNNIWLVKPTNANQGRGIEIFSDLDDLLTFVNSRPQYSTWVVQKYIERPLLFKGRKFDIRVWALFTHRHEIFFYKKGYLRTSSDEYSLSNGNNYVHLTNNCLQKFGDNYGAHEEGNTVGFEVFQQYLDDNFPEHNLTVQEHFIPRMKDLIIDSFLAVKPQLNPNKRKHCFELFGYDFLIDEDFRLWLIEINTNPYFGVPNNYIAGVLPKMMDDLLSIVVDPIYTPETKPEGCLTPNEFEVIYCEGNSSYAPPTNKRRPFSASLYPVLSLAQPIGPKAPKVDLRYLKQYKIQGVNLSTVSYKSKGKSNDEGKGKRSRSMLNGKGAHSNAHRALNHRSKSIFKNPLTAINTSVINPKPSQEYQNMTLEIKKKNGTQGKSSPSQMKTPKNPQSKHKQVTLTTTVRPTHMTERQSPVGKDRREGGSTLHQIEERASSMRRDLSKNTNWSRSFQNNTTKESNTSQGFNSHTSSQDQLVLGKDFGQEKNAETFEEFFKRVLQKIITDPDESDKIAQNIEVIWKLMKQNLAAMMKPEKLGMVQRENFLLELVNAFAGYPAIAYQVQVFLVDMILKMSSKFQICQMLVKTKFLLPLIQKYKASAESSPLKCSLLKIFATISCLREMKLVRNAKEHSPRLIGGVTGVQVLKEQQFKRALDKGLLLLYSHSQFFRLIQNCEKVENMKGDLLEVLTEDDLYSIIQQLQKEVKKRTRQPSKKETGGQEKDEACVGVAVVTDTERKVQSRSERLLEKELRDTSLQTIKQVGNVEEVLDLALSTLDLGLVLDAAKELLQKAKLRTIETRTSEIQSYKIIPSERSARKMIVSVGEGPASMRNHSRSENQSQVASPEKKYEARSQNRPEPEKAILHLKSHDFTPVAKQMVYSTKQTQVLNPYKTPEKSSFKGKPEDRKAHNILSAFLSKNAGQSLQISQSLSQMNTNHQGSQKGRHTQYQQETACYTLKKSLQSKFMPVLKDKKQPYPNVLTTNPYSPMVPGRLSDCKIDLKTSNGPTTKQITLPNRDSIVSEHRSKPQNQRKRLSDVARPYHKLTPALLSTNKKQRPPLHKGYFNNTLVQEKEVANLGTFESNDSLLEAPAKELSLEDVGDDFGTEEGIPNKAANDTLQQTQVIVSGRSAQGAISLLYNDDYLSTLYQQDGNPAVVMKRGYETSKMLDQHYLDLVRMENVSLEQPARVKLKERDEVRVGVKGENLRLFRKTK